MITNIMYKKLIKGGKMDGQQEERRKLNSHNKVLQIPINLKDLDKIKKDAEKHGRTVPKHVFMECIAKWINRI